MSRMWIVLLLLSVNAFAQTKAPSAKASRAVAPKAVAAPKAAAPQATSDESKETPKESGDVSTSGATAPKLMDGVELEAVETYINPTQNQLGLGIGIYPFDAYYYGLSVNAGYTYHQSRTLAWEVIHAQYFFSFQKDLTTELADRFSVDPTVIPKLNYIVSTDVQYVFAYGKMAMMEEYIRYFRASAMGGVGAIKTSDQTRFGVLLGVKFETFTRDSFSWTFEVRDTLAVPGFNNFMTFIVGTGISF